MVYVQLNWSKVVKSQGLDSHVSCYECHSNIIVDRLRLLDYTGLLDHRGLAFIFRAMCGMACPAVADETTILFNVTIAYILYFYVCLMYNKASVYTMQPC